MTCDGFNIYGLQNNCQDNNFADYEKIAGITNYFGVEFLKISFYLNLFVKMEFFRQKERIQVIKYIYLLKKKKIKTETEAGAHLIFFASSPLVLRVSDTLYSLFLLPMKSRP